MNRVPLIDRNDTTAERKALLDAVHTAFGTTPNMFRAVANSPAALRSMWSAFGALGGGVIAPKLGEQIAVAVADRNGCGYCLAAHTPQRQTSCRLPNHADDPRWSDTTCQEINIQQSSNSKH